MKLPRLTVKAACSAFFDSSKVIAAVDKAERKALNYGANYVKRTAQNRIRSRKRSSRPGESPTSQTGLLKRFIYATYDTSQRAALVGPALLNSIDSRGLTNGGVPSPHVLEFGGQAAIREKQLFAGGKWHPLFTRRTLREGESMRVRRFTIAARPYMEPALHASAPKLASLFANSVR